MQSLFPESFLKEVNERVTRLNVALVEVTNASIAIDQISPKIKALMTKVLDMQADVTYLQQVAEQLNTLGLPPQLLAAAAQAQPATPANPAAVDTPPPRAPMPEPIRHAASTELGNLVQEARQADPMRTLMEASSNLRGALTAVRNRTQPAAAGQPSQELPPVRGVQPAEEVTPSGASQPLEEGAAPTNVAHRFLGHFIGPGSVFASIMSPEIMPGARGFAKPGYAYLKQYAADLGTTPIADVIQWKTGFYRGRHGERQMLINLESVGIAVLLGNAESDRSLVMVHFKPGPNRTHVETLVNVEDLTVLEMQQVAEAVIQHFTELAKAA